MDCTDKYEALKKVAVSIIESRLKESRARHTYAVAQEARKLAEHYGCDADKAEVSALLHDIARNISPQQLKAYVSEFNLPEVYADNINLAHSKIAAEMLKRDLGVEDSEIIDAVAYHTTGRKGMSLLEKIVFIADAIEPGRDYRNVDRIRKAAYEDIDRACIISLSGTVDYVNSRGGYMDPDTTEALRSLKGEIQ